MRRARPDPLGAALLRGLRGCSGAGFIVEFYRSDPWMSATFTGATHRLAILLDGADAPAAAGRLAAALPEHEFSLPGNVVADATVRSCADADGGVRVEIEMLTIEE